MLFIFFYYFLLSRYANICDDPSLVGRLFLTSVTDGPASELVSFTESRAAPSVATEVVQHADRTHLSVSFLGVVVDDVIFLLAGESALPRKFVFCAGVQHGWH